MYELYEYDNRFEVRYEGFPVFEAGRENNGTINISIGSLDSPHCAYSVAEIKLIVKGLKNLSNRVVVGS
jgi:hypothetical protein